MFDFRPATSNLNTFFRHFSLQFYSQILADSLIFAGTNPALNVVKEYILKGKISGEWAVQAISQIPSSVETPTKELFQTFYVRSTP